MKQLHSKAIWLFFLNFTVISLFLAFFVGSFIAFILLSISLEGKRVELYEFWALVQITLMWEFVLFLLFVTISYFWAKLSYKYYKYELREDGFRKEHGVIWKKYVTIPYERIQNVDIYRGILARLLGLSDLQIQTAGMSATVGRYAIGGAGAEGRLPGVSREEAEKLRDDLIKRARGSKNQGV